MKCKFCVENIDSSLFVKLNGRYKESNMSNHILFEITDGRFISENKYNAASKPRNDTITTAIRLGFKPFIFNSRILGRSKIRYFRTILFSVEPDFIVSINMFRCRNIK